MARMRMRTLARLAGRLSGPGLVAAVLLILLVPALAGGGYPSLGNIATRFYRLHSDLPAAEVQDLAAFLDQMFFSYARVFHYDVRRRSTLDVYVYRTREEFLSFCAERGLGRSVLQMRGLYIPELYELAAWGSGEEARHVLAHEGTHQFIALVTKPDHQPPQWFHEGLASYFETANWKNGTLTLGAVNFDRLAALVPMYTQGHFVPKIPLGDLLTTQDFTATHYAEAWSFVYFLLHAYGGRNAEVLNRYFILIQQGQDPVRAFVAAFQTPLDAVDGAWRAYVEELLKKDLSQLLALPAESTAPSGH